MIGMEEICAPDGDWLAGCRGVEGRLEEGRAQVIKLVASGGSGGESRGQDDEDAGE